MTIRKVVTDESQKQLQIITSQIFFYLSIRDSNNFYTCKRINLDIRVQEYVKVHVHIIHVFLQYFKYALDWLITFNRLCRLLLLIIFVNNCKEFQKNIK